MSKKLAIIGAGGHGKVVGEIALLNHYKIINSIVDSKSFLRFIFLCVYVPPTEDSVQFHVSELQFFTQIPSTELDN